MMTILSFLTRSRRLFRGGTKASTSSSVSSSRLLKLLDHFLVPLTVDFGPYMKKRICRKGVPDERLHTIPVWNKKDEVYPIPDEENPLIEEVGLEDKFVVMYSGNAGLGHRFDEVLGAARHFNSRNEDLHFLFVGSGPRREDIEAFAERHALSNLTYLDYFPRDQIKYSLSLADVHLLTLRRSFAGIAVPGKLYGILASGTPVLMVGPEASDSADTIQCHDVGTVVDPGALGGHEAATEAVIETITDLYERPDRRRALGERGREVFLDCFEQARCCDQWTELLGREVGTP
jgi:colanic acid biosynthesis glycosyl transferase WcaI